MGKAGLAAIKIILILLFFSICYDGWAQGVKRSVLSPDTSQIAEIVYPKLTKREGLGIQLPVPPDDHPRLYLTAKDIPLLKDKLNDPVFKNFKEHLAESAAYQTNGNLSSVKEHYNDDLKIRDAIEAKALMYVLDLDQQKGRDAVNAVLNYFRTLKADKTGQDYTRVMGREIVTGSIVYDWCYPLLSAQQKQFLIRHMEALATQMEIGWPQIKGSSITGHTVEAQLSRDMLSLAIATYNEKPQIYERVAGRIFAEFVPARRFYEPAGYHHQGSAYGAYRFNWDMFATYIFDKMGYPDLYPKAQSQIPYYFIYSRRPDGQLLRNGDDYTEQGTPFGKWWPLGQSAFFLAGSYYKDPIVINEGLKERPLAQGNDAIFDFLFFDTKAIGHQTKNALSLTRYFQEPFGAMIARTGWEDGIASPDVVAMMKVQSYNFSNHQHLDAGSFQLYYKGPLTVQSGIYQGTTGGYGDEHFKNYSQRSIAHNTMLVYDPDEHFSLHGKAIINDGGQQYPNGGIEAENLDSLLAKGYHTGTVLAHAFGPDPVKPDFTYLKGDLTKAYSGKVSDFKRSFVFINFKDPVIPAALIVFDHLVTSKKGFKKYWLMHCVEEPKVDSIYTTVSRTQKGYAGKMINTTLLPEKSNLVINKVGGAGRAYEVFGKNFPQAMVSPAIASADSAVWRIEVSPRKPAEANLFLNVMEVMNNDVKPTKALLPERIETGLLTGAKILDRIVLFSKSGLLVNQPFELSVSGNAMVLITDLEKGDWNVGCTDHPQNTVGIVMNDQQLIYFKAGSGKYLITKVR